MLSAKHVDYQKLKSAVKVLNDHEYIDKIKLTLPKEPLYEQFMRGITALTDDQAEAESMAEATLFFNECAEGEDPVEQEKPAEEKPKAEKLASGEKQTSGEKKPAFRPKTGSSFEEIAQEMWEKGNSSPEDFTKKFTALYKDRGRTNPEFVTKRATIYRNIGYKRAKQAGTLPEGAVAPQKEKAAEE